jgi:hypothetical protein
VQVVRFTLYDVGIFPREVHVNTGIIAITIEDLSGAEASAEVMREVGLSHELVSLVTRAEYEWRGRKDVLLPPGRYAVSMTGHPENSAALVVEP